VVCDAIRVDCLECRLCVVMADVHEQASAGCAITEVLLDCACSCDVRYAGIVEFEPFVGCG
jgi:hypothetical protein